MHRELKNPEFGTDLESTAEDTYAICICVLLPYTVMEPLISNAEEWTNTAMEWNAEFSDYYCQHLKMFVEPRTFHSSQWYINILGVFVATCNATCNAFYYPMFLNRPLLHHQYQFPSQSQRLRLERAPPQLPLSHQCLQLTQ